MPWARGWCVSGALLVVAATSVSAQAPLTLADALARARDVAPELAAAEARVEAAGLGLTHAGALPNPSIELRSENWAAGARARGLEPDTFAVVSQAIELGGKREARRGLAAAGPADLAEHVRVVDRRVAVGTTPEADLLKLQTDRARIDIDLGRAAIAAERARLLLAARLDRDLTDARLQTPVVPAPPVGDAGTDAAVDSRADVAAATHVVAVARERLRLANAAGVPDLHVQGGVKRTAGINTGVVAVGVALPVFSRNGQDRALAAGDLAAAERDLAAVRRLAHGDLAVARAAATDLASRARDVRARLVDPALAARAAARAAFATGAADILRLLDAERVAADAERLANDLEIDAVLAAIDARLAAGEDPLP